MDKEKNLIGHDQLFLPCAKLFQGVGRKPSVLSLWVKYKERGVSDV